MTGFVLFGTTGWGSALVEAQFDYYGLDYRFETVGDLFKDPEARAKLENVNPLKQIPTLVLPNGQVMTESAAITLWLAQYTGRDDLVPGNGAPEQAAFLRWLIYLVANVYPTYTYADDPSRFVSVEAAQAPFKAAINAYRERLWRIVEDVAGDPWFLGTRFSALDLYVGVMTHWTPRQSWFAANAQTLDAIASQAKALEALQHFWERNFPET
ncbi:glutathione S-transferase family protein [Hyphomonas oceanitis]|uniref:glutathione S-transferase family protein n=1 Tax=Hyphomonas oceanitis TaxID=81033 RepID=UPI003001684B